MIETMGFRRSMSTSNALDPDTWVHINDQSVGLEGYHTNIRFSSKLQTDSIVSANSGSTVTTYSQASSHHRRQSLSLVRRFFQRNKQPSTFDLLESSASSVTSLEPQSLLCDPRQEHGDTDTHSTYSTDILAKATLQIQKLSQ